MYTSFLVSNFRGLRELQLNNLDHINLIAGKNNTGKTAILEALFLHSGATNPSLALNINSFRGMERFSIGSEAEQELPWDSTFFNYDKKNPITLKGTHRNNEIRTLRIYVEPLKFTVPNPQNIGGIVKEAFVFEYENERREKAKVQLNFASGQPQMSPVLPVPYACSYLAARRPVGPAEDANRFGMLEVKGQEGLVLESLRCIEPGLKKVSVILRAGEPTLHGEINGKRLIPLPLMGEGMARLATIVLAIATAPNGAVLIDEIENGLHHSVLVDVWNAVGKIAAKFYTQVFATTHSLECIRAGHQAFKGSAAYDFRVYRVERRETETHALAYEKDTLEAAIQSELEIR